MTAAPTPPDSGDTGRALRTALAAYPTGVVALAAEIDAQPVGMAVNSFTSISLEPALVAVSVARTSRTWQRLAVADRIGLSVLAADQESVSRRLSARDGDRFGDIDLHRAPGGALLVEGAALWLQAEQHATLDGGDHEIVLLKIVDVAHFDRVEPLVFHRSRYGAVLAP